MNKSYNTLIIAEAGVNHNGSLKIAKELIDVAAGAGADYVKFQTFKAENLVSRSAKKAAYQIENTGIKDEGQFEMLKKLELDLDDHQTLIAYCREKNIKFLSTAFDLESVDLLDKLGIDLFKIPSGEITNLPYLEKIASKSKPIVLSTGMANLSDIEAALTVLYANGVNQKDITVLHCNTEYPTPMEDVNLRAMNTVGAAFKVKIGYSDHTLGIEIPIAAVAMGAVCIEKHFTLDRNMEGPDHRASLEPDELKAMVNGIRNIEMALGSGVKWPTESESKNIEVARKSIHTDKDLTIGHIITIHDLRMKRPGLGISPMRINSIIGKRITKSIKKDTMISHSDFQ